jgi:hypothetical protein
MSSRILACTLVALLVFGVSSMALGSAYAQVDDLWYPGEGVKQDMYVKYKIQHLFTNDGREFELTLYFQEQQDGDLIVPAFVVDQGRVMTGTFKLSDGMAYLAGGSQVPDDMQDYVGGYQSTLHWLDSFTTKSDPKSLKAASWGRLACIGCEEIKPRGEAKVTVPAGTYDTTIIGWHRGQVDNQIWILNGFPFPVKALTYADVTTGQPPVEVAYELLETGMGKPEPPTSAEIVPKPPLTKKTGTGAYQIGIDWEPPTIEPASPVRFTVTLTDSTGFPLERANYDFTIKNSEGIVIQEFKNQNADADSGIGTHEVQIDSAGPVTVTVKINAISGQGTGQFTEKADFNVVVVPEFQVSAAIVAAAVIGLVVVMTRARSGLGSLLGSRGPL